jgi:hypothetical protein
MSTVSGVGAKPFGLYPLVALLGEDISFLLLIAAGTAWASPSAAMKVVLADGPNEERDFSKHRPYPSHDHSLVTPIAGLVKYDT